MKLFLHEIFGDLVPSSVQYVPNRGNGGDALVAASTALLMRKHGVREESGARAVLVAGGGGLHPSYTCLVRRLSRIPRNISVIILPSTVSGHWDLLRSFSNLLLLAREEMTFRLAQMNGVRTMLCHDAAFSYPYPDAPKSHGPLLSFRDDKERTIPMPPGNKIITPPGSTLFDLRSALPAADFFVREIGSHASVETNFAHVAIAASCMGIPVRFYANSYFKNKAIYGASMEGNPLVEFVE